MSWGSSWTSNKIKRLSEMYRCKSNPKIAAELGVTVPAIVYMARRLGLKKLGPGLPIKSDIELERLQDRVEELEGLLGMELRLPNEFGLTPLEMKIFGMLIRREIVNRDAIFSAVYGGMSEGEQPEPETINVHIHKIRNKLLPYGYAINSRYGVGYYMDSFARQTLESVCEGVGA